MRSIRATAFIVALFALLSMLLGMCNSSDDTSNNDDSDSSNDDGNGEDGDTMPFSEETLIEMCVDMVTVYCEKAVECYEDEAEWLFGVTDASECPAMAEEECSNQDTEEDTGEEDDCVTEWPSEELIRECIDSIDAASCETVMAVAESGSCEEVQDMMECDEDTGGDGDTDGDTDGDSDADTDTDADAVEINIEGCVAAVAATCTVADQCLEMVSSTTDRVTEAVENCPTRVEENDSAIEDACQEYLETEVPAENEMAVYLNSATADDINDCITGDNCTPAFLLALVDGLEALAESGDKSDLVALIAPIVVNCY